MLNITNKISWHINKRIISYISLSHTIQRFIDQYKQVLTLKRVHIAVALKSKKIFFFSPTLSPESLIYNKESGVRESEYIVEKRIGQYSVFESAIQFAFGI